MSTITLPNIRVSSDLTVKLKLKDGGVAIDWSTLQNIKVGIHSDAQRAKAGNCGVSIDAEDPTILVCTYAANKPQYLGVNRIIVTAKYMGETKTYDKPAFNFVRWTDDQAGEQITIDDPDVDVEIEVQDISSSILQEAVDEAFTAADRANDAAAAAEHMVDIHTGPQGEKGDKGDTGEKGDTGDAAGFGTFSVTETEDGGDPSVTVQTSGPDTAKNVSFQLKNFKGDKGDKGDQGNSGYQGTAGELEVVNNLTDGGSTAALSAEMGKTLEGEVSQLEAKVTGLNDVLEVTQIRDLEEGATESYYINYSTGSATSSSTNKATGYIDVSKYRGKTIQYLQNVYTVSSGSVGMAFYDANRVFVSGVPCHFGGSEQGCEETTTIVPNSAYYARFSIFNDCAESFYVKVLDDYQSGRIDRIEDEVGALDTAVFGVKLVGSKDSTGTRYFDFAFIPGVAYTIKNTTPNGNINAFTSDGANDIETIKIGLASGSSEVFTPTIAATKIRVYFTASSGGSFVIRGESLPTKVDKLENEVSVIGDATIPIIITENSNGYYYHRDVGETISSESSILASSDGKYKAIDLSTYSGKKIKFKITGTATTSGRATMLCANGVVVASYYERDILGQDIILTIPFNATLYESHHTGSSFSGEIITNGLSADVQELKDDAKQLAECFVSPTGSDTNDGSLYSPFATVAKAIESGYKNICVFAGTYKESISISDKQGVNIYAFDRDTYDGNKRKRPVFTNGEEYDTFQTASGYKYFAPTDVPSKYTDVFVNQTVEPIITYQSFANTYTVGLWAKCSNPFDDFLFKPVLSMAELSENNTFFFDGTNVCFNTDAEIKGVVIVGDTAHLLSVSNCNGLRLSGLAFKYGRNDTVSILESNNVFVENCEFSHSQMRNNVDYSQSDIHLVNCESYKARRDGFNSAYYGIAYLENCNSRYNYDDGESSHEYCEVEILGGDYSHNGKAGHAPVNGCKFKCNGTYSHHNAQYGLLRPGVGAYDVEPYLISNSVFIGNGTSDIETYLELNLMNCKYGTRTGSGTINDLTGN